jgi:hypothetical protein
MAIPFVRPPRRCSWLPTELAGPLEGYTLRECHVLFLLCSLPACVRRALLDWLLDPTDLRRWPPLTSFSSRRALLTQDDLRGKTLDDYRELLFQELQVIRQTLDFPQPALSEIIRYGLLVAHGARLRQIAWAMRPRIAEREITRMIAVSIPNGI